MCEHCQPQLYFAVPNGEQWRVPVLNELLDPELEVPGFLSEEIKEMIRDLISEQTNKDREAPRCLRRFVSEN